MIFIISLLNFQMFFFRQSWFLDIYLQFFLGKLDFFYTISYIYVQLVKNFSFSTLFFVTPIFNFFDKFDFCHTCVQF